MSPIIKCCAQILLVKENYIFLWRNISGKFCLLRKNYNYIVQWIYDIVGIMNGTDRSGASAEYILYRPHTATAASSTQKSTSNQKDKNTWLFPFLLS